MNTPDAARLMMSALALTCTGASAADIRYQLTPIQGADATLSTVVNDLNDRGEVVGRVSADRVRAFHWKNGVYTDISDQIGSPYFNDPVSINNRSQIVGTYLDAEFNEVGFLLENGQKSTLSVNGEFFSPSAINDRGQIIGMARVGQDFGALLLDDEEVIQLPDLGPEYGAIPRALNRHGVATGTLSRESGTATGLWVPPYADVTVITGLPGANGSYFWDLNDRGQLIGQSIFPYPASTRGFIWAEGVATELPPLFADAYATFPQEINRYGVVVGSTRSTGQSVATVWYQGEPANLNDLVCPNDPLKSTVELVGATQINDRGQIVATHIEELPDTQTILRQYLLTPVTDCGSSGN